MIEPVSYDMKLPQGKRSVPKLILASSSFIVVSAVALVAILGGHKEDPTTSSAADPERAQAKDEEIRLVVDAFANGERSKEQFIQELVKIGRPSLKYLESRAQAINTHIQMLQRQQFAGGDVGSEIYELLKMKDVLLKIRDTVAKRLK